MGASGSIYYLKALWGSGNLNIIPLPWHLWKRIRYCWLHFKELCFLRNGSSQFNSWSNNQKLGIVLQGHAAGRHSFPKYGSAPWTKWSACTQAHFSCLLSGLKCIDLAISIKNILSYNIIKIISGDKEDQRCLEPSEEVLLWKEDGEGKATWEIRVKDISV